MQATPDPSVFTKYNAPTELPTLGVEQTKYSTRSGKVDPIKMVGTTTSRKLSMPVAQSGWVTVYSATWRKRLSETKPKIAVPSSAAPKKIIGEKRLPRESTPPPKLPRPRPSIK